MCRIYAGQDPGRYRPETRHLRLNGQSTSVRLEAAFWAILDADRRRRGGLDAGLHLEAARRGAAAARRGAELQLGAALHLPASGSSGTSAARGRGRVSVVREYYPRGRRGRPMLLPAAGRAAAQGGRRLAKAVHAMVRVLDEARSVDFYARAFGLAVADRIDFETFTLVYMRNAEADFEVELTVNKGRTEPYDLGDGYGHLAVVVDDLDAEHARLDAAGLGAAQDRRLPERRRAGGAVLLRRRPGRLPDRGDRAGRALRLTAPPPASSKASKNGRNAEMTSHPRTRGLTRRALMSRAVGERGDAGGGRELRLRAGRGLGARGDGAEAARRWRR